MHMYLHTAHMQTCVIFHVFHYNIFHNKHLMHVVAYTTKPNRPSYYKEVPLYLLKICIVAIILGICRLGIVDLLAGAHHTYTYTHASQQ